MKTTFDVILGTYLAEKGSFQSTEGIYTCCPAIQDLHNSDIIEILRRVCNELESEIDRNEERMTERWD